MEILDQQGLTQAQVVEQTKKKNYPKPSVTADMLVFLEGKLLLIRRGRHPYAGMWATPGGFVDPNERVEEAARRELLEETGLTGVTPTLLGVYSKPGRDPRGWNISCAYTCQAPAGSIPQAGDDAARAGWFTVKKRPSGYTLSCEDVTLQIETDPQGNYLSDTGFAFDHGEIVLDALHYWQM